MTPERFMELTIAAARRHLTQVEAFELFAALLECRPDLSAEATG